MGTSRRRLTVFDGDPYADAAIADPYPLYGQIRDLAPVVWLSAHDAWAIGRYDDVRCFARW